MRNAYDEFPGYDTIEAALLTEGYWRLPSFGIAIQREKQGRYRLNQRGHSLGTMPDARLAARAAALLLC